MKHKHAEFIKAWVDGENVQCFADGLWSAVVGLRAFDYFNEFRIKPKAQTYRVALMAKPDGNGFMTLSAENADEEEKLFQRSQCFVRWLTDRIEYEV